MAQYTANELFKVFIKWVNVFEVVTTPVKHVFELSDGVVLFKLLAKLSPTYFDLQSLVALPRLEHSKTNNIIAIKQNLEQFFNDVIDEDVAVDSIIDHGKITCYSNYSDEQQVLEHYTRLLEMVLLCAIKCEGKQAAIHCMQSLSDEDQFLLMKVLQTLMSNIGFDVAACENNAPSTVAAKLSTKTPQKKEFELCTPKGDDKHAKQPPSFRRLSLAKYSAHNKKTTPFMSRRQRPPAQPRALTTTMDSPTPFVYAQPVSTRNLHHDNLQLKEQNTELQHALDAVQQSQTAWLAEKQECEEQQVRKYTAEIAEYQKTLLAAQTENQSLRQQLQELRGTQQHKLSALRAELDIAQHQSRQALALEKRVQSYEQRLEHMNEVQHELGKYQQQCAQLHERVAQLQQQATQLPELRRQMERYKAEMIEYKVASIGRDAVAGTALSDSQVRDKLVALEERNLALSHTNAELQLRLQTARQEITAMRAELSAPTAAELSACDGVGDDSKLRETIRRLQADNQRLQTLTRHQQSMQDLMDELDTKTRLLQSTEDKFTRTQRSLDATRTELESTRQQMNEWMRDSCSPQQYQSALRQSEQWQQTVQELQGKNDALREEKITHTTQMQHLELELARHQQKYRDFYQYAEQEKQSREQQLTQYKNVVREVQSAGNKEQKTQFEARKYFTENKELKEKLSIVTQEMKCVQNACMHLLKRQVLMENGLLSNHAIANAKHTNSRNSNENECKNSTQSQSQQPQPRGNTFIQKPKPTATTFTFRR